MQVHKLTVDDAAAGYRLTLQHSWPHRYEDWQLLLSLGEGYAMEQAGEVIATAAAWRWGTEYASIGVVVVDRDWQGRGIGKQLMTRLMDDFPTYTLRLHATEQGAKLYQKLGFVGCGRLYQYQTRELTKVEIPVIPHGFELKLATVEDHAALVELETAATGMVRPQIYHYLLNQQRVLILNDNQGRLVGSVGCHRYGHGYSLGPCYVTDADYLSDLLQYALSMLAGKFVRLDIDSQVLSESWFDQWQFKRVDDPLIMSKVGSQILTARSAIAVTVMSPALG